VKIREKAMQKKVRDLDRYLGAEYNLKKAKERLD
jgi:hypothetical protein